MSTTTFADEYQNLQDRVEIAFANKREELKTIKFLDFEGDKEENDEDYNNALENCPTTYYNHPISGEEKHGYVIEIDSDGIHIVDSDDYTNVDCLGLNDLNGLFYSIELLENIDRHLNKTK